MVHPCSIGRRTFAALLPLAAALPATAQCTWLEEVGLTPGGSLEAHLRFGQSVAVSGDTAVVGAPGEEGLVEDSGKAYVYVRAGTGWVEQAVLVASDGGGGWFSDQFGAAVAIDADTIVVGAPEKEANYGVWFSGVAYVYVRTGTAWFEKARLTSSDIAPHEKFGRSLAVSGDTVVVGVPYDDVVAGGTTYQDQGSAFVFTRTGTIWSEQAKLLGSQPQQDGYFGESVAFDAGTAIVGVPAGAGAPGSAYVFVRSAGIWSEQAQMKPAGGYPGDRFGASVSVVGDRFLAGAPAQGDGSAYVFERTGTSWSESAELTPSDPDPTDAFGCAVALEVDVALVGAALDDVSGIVDAGSAYAFRRNGSSWTEQSKLVASVPDPSEFATAVALSGNTAWIGAPLRDEGLTLGDVRGLAPALMTGSVRGFDFGSGKLAAIDETTASSTLLASFGPNNVKSLAFDSTTGTLFGVDVATDQLVVIDAAGGVIGAVGPVGFDRVQGLAYDSSAGVLYGVDRNTSQLITIDTATGTGTAVGPLGIAGFRSLAFDVSSNRLFGTAGSQGQVLCRVNRVTGAATIKITLGSAGIEGLTYDTAAGLFFAADSVNGWLLSIDPSNWMVRLAGTIGSQADAGIAYSFAGAGGAPTAYCTAGTSSSGCSALLSTSGTASATAASGFNLTAAGVEGAKGGLFFYGANGRQANPWGNGTSFQCVAPPVARGGLLPGSGTPGACDGGFAQDLNARWCPACPKPSHNPGSGATVQAQLWYRDPLSTSNRKTSLSDALEFVVCP